MNTIARSKTPYLAGDEEVEDTEMVHAIAPGATLDVVLLPQDTTSSSANFAAAATKVIQAGVALHAAVISISGSDGEHFFTRAEVAQMHAALEQARDHHVTVVASSGDLGAISDDGPPRQVSLPASDPLVLAVGGTILDATRPTGTYLGEMAWNGGTDASGGGYSSLFARPSYQDGVARTGTIRGVPDVAADADSSTAMALEYSDGELRPATGTSASTPLWAGVIALADQAGRPPPGLRQPGHLRHRPQPRLPPGLPRRGHRRQLGAVAHRGLRRLQRRTRLGPGHRLGQPRRPAPRPAAGAHGPSGT